MANIKLKIEYDGSDYCGWQVQKNTRMPQPKTIQQVLEKTLQKVLQEKIKLIGSGRTDSGVGALGQVANFKTASKLKPQEIRKALNSLLPKDISIKEASIVNDGFHSRYWAKDKEYRYIIFNSKNRPVFYDKFSWRVPYSLNIELMRKEANVLSGCHDFNSFCAAASSVKNTVRDIKKIELKIFKAGKFTDFFGLEDEARLIVITIIADGFLYNMARNIIGTLVEIGRGRLKKGSMKRILQAKDRKAAGPTAPAKGLFLVKVNY